MDHVPCFIVDAGQPADVARFAQALHDDRLSPQAVADTVAWLIERHRIFTEYYVPIDAPQRARASIH